MNKMLMGREIKAFCWRDEAEKLSSLLSRLSFTDSDGVELPQERGFSTWSGLTRELRDNKRVCFLVGNGASASMASHISADLAKNALVHTQVFSDLSLITAMANDISYNDVYSEPLKARGAPGDMLVAISSSGKSPNILKAVEAAKGLGMTVVTLSAMGESNPLRASGGLNAYVPAKTYGNAETCHAAILHCWVDLLTLPDRS